MITAFIYDITVKCHPHIVFEAYSNKLPTLEFILTIFYFEDNILIFCNGR